MRYNMHDERRAAMIAPLVNLLLPTANDMARARVPTGQRFVVLDHRNWPEQFKHGIDQVLGISITWG